MRSKVFVVAADGGQSRELTTELPSAYQPIWSPDGRYILVSGSIIADISVPADWYIVPAAGGPPVRVDGMTGLRQTLADVVPYYAWTESNDVLFSAARGDSTNLWRVPLQTEHWRLIPRARDLASLSCHSTSTGLAPRSAPMASAFLRASRDHAGSGSTW